MEIGLYKTYVSARKVISLPIQLTNEQATSIVLFIGVAYTRNDTSLLLSEQRFLVLYDLAVSLEKQLYLPKYLGD